MNKYLGICRITVLGFRKSRVLFWGSLEQGLSYLGTMICSVNSGKTCKTRLGTAT